MEARPSEYERDDWTAVVWALTRLARSPGRLYARLAQEVSRPGLNMRSASLPGFCQSAGTESILSLFSWAAAAQCLGGILVCFMLCSPDPVHL